ncbi:MAG: hypothetical protein R3C53_01615 [Pirellulaceae bacterium]
MKVIPKIALLMTRMATVLALMLAAMAVPRVANAEEPYQRFLQRLRDEQLYDLGDLSRRLD